MMAQKTLHNAHKVPVRPAPPPPVSAPRSVHSHGITGSVPMLSRAQPPAEPRNKTKKTAPPPRPPPPKASAQLRAVQNAIVFTEMLQHPARQQQQTTNMLLLGSSQTAPDLLINWESPPTSPTPGRSSSDGLSLKSFGSDSSGTAMSGLGGGGGGGSIISGMGGGLHGARSESGFESESDAWTISEPVVTSVARSSPGLLGAENSVKPFSMPTIIRPNRSGNKPLPPPPPSLGPSTHLKALEKVKAIPPSAQFSLGGSNSHLADLLDLDLDCNDPSWTAPVRSSSRNSSNDEDQDYSPPEPCIPPPPAPPVLLIVTEPTPPRAADPHPVPYAEALYDYSSGHPGDLNFKEGDRILLTARVNEEWYRGSLNSSVEGLFPASFVRVLVPLQDSAESDQSLGDNDDNGTYRAVAMYAFAAETDQDLSLEEGDIVEVTESLGNGWLQGRHCLSGRRGQFPEAFVRRHEA